MVDGLDRLNAASPSVVVARRLAVEAMLTAAACQTVILTGLV